MNHFLLLHRSPDFPDIFAYTKALLPKKHVTKSENKSNWHYFLISVINVKAYLFLLIGSITTKLPLPYIKYLISLYPSFPNLLLCFHLKTIFKILYSW